MFFNYAQWDKGYFFREICTNPEKYLFKQPVHFLCYLRLICKHVKNWLIELKKVHKKFLFLLTNSLPEYTDMLMQYRQSLCTISLTFTVLDLTGQNYSILWACMLRNQFSSQTIFHIMVKWRRQYLLTSRVWDGTTHSNRISWTCVSWYDPWYPFPDS